MQRRAGNAVMRSTRRGMNAERRRGAGGGNLRRQRKLVLPLLGFVVRSFYVLAIRRSRPPVVRWP